MGATAGANRPAVVTAGGRRGDLQGGPALPTVVAPRGLGVDEAGRGRGLRPPRPARGYPRGGTPPRRGSRHGAATVNVKPYEAEPGTSFTGVVWLAEYDLRSVIVRVTISV